MKVIYTPKSYDKKTGEVPVSYLPRSTCPSICPLKNDTCYGEAGHCRMVWDNMLEKRKCGISWDSFLDKVSNLLDNQIWRDCVLGDFPGKRNRINKTMALQLAKANRGRKIIKYTHYPPNKWNLEILREMKSMKCPVSLSTNKILDVDRYMDFGLPVVTILPSDIGVKRILTPKGNTVVVCPASYSQIQCINCRICANPRRGFVVGFPAHGIRKRKLDKMIV